MIFQEVEDGMEIRIPHKEMMNPDTAGFIITILYGRDMYQKYAKEDKSESIIKKMTKIWGQTRSDDTDADLDDDNSNGE